MDEIKSTTDYGIFTFLKENRFVEEPKLHKMKESIKQKNLLRYAPIIVNESLEVLDGQTRLKAAESLKLPIYYIIARNLDCKETIKLLNINQLNWKPCDYLNLYAKGYENENYIRFSKFIKKYGLNINAGKQLFNMRTRNAFNDGSFIFDRTDEDIDEFMSFMNSFWRMIKEYDYQPWKHFYSRIFLKTMVVIFDSARLDLDLLIEKCRQFPRMLTQCCSQIQYIEMILNIYNRNRKKINHIRTDMIY